MSNRPLISRFSLHNLEKFSILNWFEESEIVLVPSLRLGEKAKKGKFKKLKLSNPMSEKNWYTVKGACQFLGLSRMTLLQAEAQGFIEPHRTPGGHRRYSPESLQQYLATVRSAHSPPSVKKGKPVDTGHQSRQNVTPGLELLELLTVSWHENEAADLATHLRQVVLNTGAEWSAGLTYSRTQNSLNLQASYGLPHWVRNRLRASSVGPKCAEVLKTGHPQSFTALNSDFDLSTPTGSGIILPLRDKSNMVGLWLLFSSKWTTFDENLLQALHFYSRHLAVCLHAELLEKRATRLTAENQFLEKIAKINSLSESPEGRLAHFTRAANGLLQGENPILLLKGEEQPKYLRFSEKAGHPPPPLAQAHTKKGQGVADWVISYQKPHISRCLDNDTLCQMGDRTHPFHVVLPILFSNRKIEGVLHFNTTKILDEEREKSLALVQRMGTTIALYQIK